MCVKSYFYCLLLPNLFPHECRIFHTIIAGHSKNLCVSETNCSIFSVHYFFFIFGMSFFTFVFYTWLFALIVNVCTSSHKFLLSNTG